MRLFKQFTRFLLCSSFAGLTWLLISINIQAQDDTWQTIPLENLNLYTVRLWGTQADGSNAIDSSLTVFLPQGAANGTAVIIAPGGAYSGLSMVLEGRQIADWFTARGITAFVLKYRVGPKHPYPEPLVDGQRAVRLVRANSERFHIESNKIGFVGFSAGGHLAATVAGTSDDGNPAASDAIDKVSDRPDFVILGYPWLNAMQPKMGSLINYCSMMKTIPLDQCNQFDAKYTPAKLVNSTTPPTFIYSTSDDKTVPVSASVEYYSALIRAGVSAELHLYRHGAHGSGLGNGDEALDTWPLLLEIWLRDQGLLNKHDPAAQH
jgi:acetyl esterase/lipase